MASLQIPGMSEWHVDVPTAARCATTDASSQGNNEYRQRDDTPTDGGYVALACYGYHSCALRNDGCLVAWGHTGDFQLTPREATFWPPR